jgi:hypothetical protein
MSTAFWIADGLTLWLSGRSITGAFLNWRGIQRELWPVTLVVRAAVRDPFKDPEPVKPDYDRIFELERKLGIAPLSQVASDERLQDDEEPDQPSYLIITEADVINSLVWCSAALAYQYRTVPQMVGWGRDVYMLTPHSPKTAWAVLRDMQVYAGLHNPRGFEDFQSEHELYERYDELRAAVWLSQERGDALMLANALSRLTDYCARHHNMPMGRNFPYPGAPNYVPWKPGSR